MPRSGGVNISKTGLIIGLVLAISICAAWIGYGLSQSAEYERQSNNQRTKYSEYTRQKIAETCVGIPKVEAIKCRYDAFDAQREYDYNQSDLVAQRQSALWAYIMGAAAVIGVALSAFGVWLVKTTFDEAQRANQISREGLYHNLRAYITIDSAERHFKDGWECVTLLINNSGASPATKVEMRSIQYDVRNGGVYEIEFQSEVQDIGGQTKHGFIVKWYEPGDFINACISYPDKIQGVLKYSTSIPTQNGEFELIEVPFAFEPTSEKVGGSTMKISGRTYF